jgi:hypothetical protein
MAQVVEHLPKDCKALSSKPSTAQNKTNQPKEQSVHKQDFFLLVPNKINFLFRESIPSELPGFFGFCFGWFIYLFGGTRV